MHPVSLTPKPERCRLPRTGRPATPRLGLKRPLREATMHPALVIPTYAMVLKKLRQSSQAAILLVLALAASQGTASGSPQATGGGFQVAPTYGVGTNPQVLPRYGAIVLPPSEHAVQACQFTGNGVNAGLIHTAKERITRGKGLNRPICNSTNPATGS